MANPAPTINQINAFNATQGTIIDFNIIGGTELVRSNRIYIYDLSDNSLICTHLYVSTESIHELPANTDSSIVYESGKSSADFVNGAQYYAQIQTYTDTAGTEGGSGLSVAKMFWCLVDPTLTITTIPSTISTTSYNVSATYDANTSVVSNIIQQYQFSLYSATGSLLQSSGVIVGSGTQQGTSTAYDISYNFTGLSVGSSYYVVVDVTTTQGMGVSTQSGTFTVSIDTPTLGEATVVNNACDGYISVTSNLSGEYGGSASGEIATFVTDSVNDVSSLKVTLTPQQDATPWIGTTHDTTPYLMRAMPTQSNDYNRESGVIVGGTVNWNQHSPITWRSGTWGGVTATNNGDGSYTLNGECTSTSYLWLAQTPNGSFLPFMQPNHKLLAIIGRKSDADIRAQLILYGSPAWSYTISNSDYAIVNIPSSFDTFRSSSWVIQFTTGNTYSNDTIIPQLFDLTQMFGSTIADYIYSLEQANVGAGVAWLKSYGFLTDDYYPYNAGELMSVQATAHVTTGFNQWDEEWEVGRLNTLTGGNSGGNGIRSTNMSPILPSTAYHCTRGSYADSNATVLCYYDGNGEYISYENKFGVNGFNFTTPSNAHYLRINIQTSTAVTYNHDICINISKTTGSPKNGDYVAYDGHSYALDSSVTLQGVFQLENGELKAYGDIYPPSGDIQRKFAMVDLGTLNYTRSASGLFQTDGIVALVKKATTSTVPTGWLISASYTEIDSTSITGPSGTNPSPNMVMAENTQGRLYFNNTSYTDAAAFKTAMSGVYLVYELATPTTETAQAYTNPQIVDPDGTEEYVTANNVPVGHDSTYSLVCPISGYDEVSAEMRGKNLFDQNIFLNATGWTEEDGVYHGLNTELYNEYSISFPVDVLPYNGQLTFSFDYHNANVSYRSGYLYFRYTDGTESYKELKSADWTHITFTSTQGKTVKGILIGVSNTLEIYLKNVQLEFGSTATDYEPYQGRTITEILVQNVWDGEWESGGISSIDGSNYTNANAIRSKNYIPVVPELTYYMKSPSYPIVFLAYDADKNFMVGAFGGYSTAQIQNNKLVIPSGVYYLRFNAGATTYNGDIRIYYPPMPDGQVYGGTIDLVSGVLTVTHKVNVYDGSEAWTKDTDLTGGIHRFYLSDNTIKKYSDYTNVLLSNRCKAVNNYQYAPNMNEDFAITAYSIFTNNFNWAYIFSKTIDTVNGIKSWLAEEPLQFCYELATPLTYQLTPQEIQTLVGTNNVWSDSGDVEITYNIPITNLLVKRQDVADVSGTWLTLYSQPVTQASDMDFTFIDFLNQYGKTYKYALVPLLTQTQSGVEVEVEGGYTVSDEVQSIFDGVFIADSTGSQKCKANVGYGDVDMNQAVGTITPIGSKYPVVITNSKNQYHNGSITGTIVPDDYYSNGNLSRIDMVNKRNELEQFLTNKRAKIIKDWNSNIWLVMIMENINCTFNNEYGMGIVNFTANWIEVGDPTNQQDLQATGLIDVGGA